ncbi:MAG: RNA polymerase sigma factor [Candidatus Omnitrophica bacterium]|nr:RNA polymerase sigma factor [Candidatus Omnitrophota bacterium]
MNDIPDDVLKKAAAGGLESFEAVYKSLSGFVYNVAFRVVNNRQDAEEVTQEVFLTMYRRLKDFRFESSFKTWVYRITVNHAINYGRKASRGKNRSFEYDDEMQVTVTPGVVEAEIEKEYVNTVVEKLLGAISPEQKACMVLRGMEGLSYKQIAEILEVNINTVRTRLRRAREILLSLRKKVEYERV